MNHVDILPAAVGHPLPHSLEAEEYLLSCCLIDSADVLSRCIESGLTPESFYDHRHGLILEHLLRLFKRGETEIDLAVLSEEMKAAGKLEAIGGYGFLSHVSGHIPTTAQAGYFIEAVRQLALDRAELQDLSALREALVAGNRDTASRARKNLRTIEERRETLLDRIRAARLDPAVQPPPLREVIRIGEVCIATPGNLGAVCAAPKAGKSSFLGAIIAAALGQPNRDYLGISSENSKGLALVHLDTEQAPQDHYGNIRTAMRRARVSEAPTWLHSYATAGWTPRQRREALSSMLRHARRECGGVHAVLLDGIADLVSDPNDGAECFSFLDELQGLAVQFDCPIFGTLHLNPGRQKTRGHLGSQLERRAESNLVLERNSKTNRTVVFSAMQRRAPILKADGPCFLWSDEEQMHVSVSTVGANKKRAEVARLSEMASEILAETPNNGLRSTDLVRALGKAAGCKKRTAEELFRRMKQLGVIKAAPGRLWERVI